MNKKDRVLGVLYGGAIGDIVGFKNGRWEFCKNTKIIHQQLKELGGIRKLNLKGWRASDDTVMHIATLLAIVDAGVPGTNMESNFKMVNKIMPSMAKRYIESFDDMNGRGPGITCGSSVHYLERVGIKKWNTLPYSPSGGGCGGSMRAQGIGLYCHDMEKHMEQLIALAIESGRLTHNHPTGFLGAVVSAVFTAYAYNDVEPHLWPVMLMENVLPLAKKYCKEAKRDWERIGRDFHHFEAAWTRYMKDRNIGKDASKVHFEKEWDDPQYRDDYYQSYSYNGWAGASGDDSVIIAYDTYLHDHSNVDALLVSSALHKGDSDSTGTIALSWFGARYGYNALPNNLLVDMDKSDTLQHLSEELIKLM